ncbi:MAG TPA: hypothetical protein VJN94_02160 [Candidatus Binataceae bacterium]|nr:hypothetical protein [Candidatus Binataceae bacterium]
MSLLKSEPSGWSRLPSTIISPPLLMGIEVVVFAAFSRRMDRSHLHRSALTIKAVGRLEMNHGIDPVDVVAPR